VPPVDELAPGLWRWTARHPEWHPGDFGAEVASFAVRAGDGTLMLVDPLLPPEPEAVLETIESELGDRLAILITIPYHVRSAEELWQRFGKDAETTVHGHPAAAKRLEDRSAFHEIEPGTSLPAGVTAHTIGKPRRFETPLHLPSHGALVFGDAVAEVDGRLVVWATDKVDAKVERFYRERFNPTLEPLLELDFDRVLVTHGQPVLSGGKRALRQALDGKPWYHRG
jgi:glyoxylase-like metal-dependent hydrolase (beta-lactamase superfamily II)